MANIDGLPVNSAVTHAEFMSRTEDTSTTGKVDINNTTDSTSPTNGSIHTTGGMGIEKSLNVGQNLVVNGNLNLAGSLALSSGLPISSGGTGQTNKTSAFDALSPLNTKGDILVHNGTNSVRFPIGGNGQFLIADSTQTNGMRWGTNVSYLGYRKIVSTSGTTNYTVNTSDDVVLVDASAGFANMDIPSPAGIAGKTIFLQKIDASNNGVSVSGFADLLFQEEFVELISDGVTWIQKSRTQVTLAKNYSPNWTGIGTVSNNNAIYYRNGSFLVISAFVTSGTVSPNAVTMSLPSGFAISNFLGKIPNATARKHSFGTGKRIVASGGPFGYQADGIAGPILTGIYTGTNTNVQITYAQGSGQHYDSNANAFIASGDSIDIERLEIPILGY